MNSIGWIDYTTLLITIIVPIIISLCFGVSSQHGTRNLGVFPVFMSLTASTLSGFSIVGLTSEAYLNGIIYIVLNTFTNIFAILINVYCFVPVLYNLQIESAYAYFELRFDARVRKLASVIYLITQVAHAAVSTYSAAVVVSQFSGLTVNATSYGLLMFCILCTLIGGFRGVVWTDTFQAIIMWIFLVSFVILAYINGGGLSSIYNLSKETGRLDIFVMDFDPTIRLSFWSGLLGLFCMNLALGIISPSSFQRFASVKSEGLTRWAAYLNCIQVNVMLILLTFGGLGLYASYYGCDPKSAGATANYLNLIGYFIHQKSENIPGIMGLFIAGMISSSLSTMSTNINTAGTLLYTEFFKNCWISSRVSQVNAIRILTGIAGLLSMAFMLLIVGTESIVDIFQLFIGATLGLSVGLFILGMFFLNANSKGTVFGGLLSLTVILTMSVGSRLYVSKKASPYKTLSTDRCPSNTTLSPSIGSPNDVATSVPWLFRISSIFYPFIAASLTTILGLVIGCFVTEGRVERREKLRKELFSPAVVRWFRDRFYQEIALSDNEKAIEK